MKALLLHLLMNETNSFLKIFYGITYASFNSKDVVQLQLSYAYD